MKLFASFTKLAAASLLALTGAATATTASADLSDLRGTWINVDDHTRGITKVVIGGSGSVVSLSAWGSCSPSDCVWGEVPATPLTNSVSDAPDTADRIVAVYEKSYKMSILNAYRSGNQLIVDNATDFNDGRTDTFRSYAFKRLPVFINPGVINKFPMLNLGLMQPVTNLDQMAGAWKNVDANTRGISKLRITVDGAEVDVQAWGSCSPTDCNWGWTDATPLTTSVSANPVDANTILATWDSNIATRTAIITRGGTMLTVQVTTTYKDSRSDRFNTYVFVK